MSDSTPICRCRVLYLGSAVPRQSKDGLQGIQEPLRSLYPSEGAVVAKGIDSWLSVWSNGILLENVDENLKQITRFFPIESLHYCAAVRQVLIPERRDANPAPKFLPLDSPFARMPRAQHPPIFSAILRRTMGIKVLECHVFICKREAAANALVRCCFHAYADNSYARQLETGAGATASSTYGTLQIASGNNKTGEFLNENIYNNQGLLPNRATSTTTLDSAGKRANGTLHETSLNTSNNFNSYNNTNEQYSSTKNYGDGSTDLNVIVDDETSVYNGDENHKVWNGSQDHLNRINVESFYEVFPNNSNTFGRPTRARQISVPISVPPPPSKDEFPKKKKDKKNKIPSGSQSLYGTLIRPKPMHPGTISVGVNHGNLIPYGQNMTAAFPPSRHFHTISHRGFSYGSVHSPVPYNLSVPRQPIQTSHFSRQMPVLLPQQYATLQPPRSIKKQKNEKKNNCIPVGMPIVPPIYAYHHNPGPPFAPSLTSEPRSLANSNRKLAASLGNRLEDSGNSGTDSPSGTGIYKRKGHLNERAFSFSIRQEHRSRSHGSLASLQFNTPDLKKEREIAQMVAGLELNDVSNRSIDPEMQNSKKILHIYKRGDALENVIYDNGDVATNLYGNKMIPSNNFGKLGR